MPQGSSEDKIRYLSTLKMINEDLRLVSLWYGNPPVFHRKLRILFDIFSLTDIYGNMSTDFMHCGVGCTCVMTQRCNMFARLILDSVRAMSDLRKLAWASWRDPFIGFSCGDLLVLKNF